jgi:peptidoglycan/LPS O-acetylase OafA/YrhL
VSIAMVLLAHSESTAGFPKAFFRPVLDLVGGDLGVRFFFTISGFLITWLMLVENDRTGGVSLKNFYIRRAFRILPVCVAFLGILFLLQWFTPYRQTAGQWLANFTFTTNYVPVPGATNHLWSLAVEEQFYLLWPVLFVTFGLAAKLKRSRAILAAPLIIAPLFRFLAVKHSYPAGIDFLFAHSSFFRYFDTLAIGCLCAIISVRKQEATRKFFRKYLFLIPVAALIFLCAPCVLFALELPGRIQESIDYSFQAFGFSLLLMQSLYYPQAKGYAWLNWRWVRFFGVLSYSLYIWQEIFAGDPRAFGLGHVWWMAFPGWWIATLAVALLSYYGLERPFLAMRARFRDNRRAAATTAGNGENYAV